MEETELIGKTIESVKKEGREYRICFTDDTSVIVAISSYTYLDQGDGCTDADGEFDREVTVSCVAIRSG